VNDLHDPRAEFGIRHTQVSLHSDSYSEGGAAIFYLIKSQLDFYHELRGERTTLPWKIKEIFEEAGF
jgi:hypothetical protein